MEYFHTLEQYQCGTSTENQIYNAETNTLYIEDVTDLTIPEMQCILACRTNNRSLNSFAGEIVYHAVVALETSPWDENTVLENMYYFHPLAGPLPIALEMESHFLYKSAITAELNMGKIEWYRLIFFDGPAFKWNISDYVVEQREIWGDM